MDFTALTSLVPLAAEVAAKSVLWLGAILLLTVFMRGASASARHLVLVLGIAGLFALPFLSTQIPWRIAVPLAAAPDAHRAQPLDTDAGAPVPSSIEATDAAVAAPSLGAPSRPVAPAPAPQRGLPLIPTLFTAWGVAAAFLIGRLLLGHVRVRRVFARSADAGSDWEALLAAVAAQQGVRRSVRLLVTDDTPVPFTTGMWRPVIVLPAVADEWPADKRETVLLHEMAHVARLDLLTAIAAQVACALMWFNPLVWVTARRLRIEAERACDDVVLRAGMRATDYADQLLQVVRETQPRFAPAVAVAMARRSAFEGRLLAILSSDTNRRRLSAGAASVVAAGVLLVALPIAAMRPGAQLPVADTQAASESEQDTFSAVTAQDTAPRGAAVRALVVALKDDDARVRLAAVMALGAREARQAAPELTPALEDSDVSVRRAVAEALASMRDPRSVAALLRALRSDTDAGVREMAAYALGEIRDERAVSGLVEALAQERVTAVRRRIVWALAELDNPAAAGALVDALRDGDAEVRAQAVRGLGEIEARSSGRQIIPLLRDSNAEVRRAAAWALGELKVTEAIDALMAAAGDPDTEVRQSALSALSDMEVQQALPAFVRALRDDNVDVRRTAASAIGDIEGLRRAPRELVDALADADVEVRQNAVHALGHIRDAATIPAIVPLTRGGQPFAVREAAINALTEFERASGVEAVFLELMKDPDPKIRRLAAQGLGRD